MPRKSHVGNNKTRRSRVVANVKFSYVLEKIKPLEKEQQKLQTNLKMAEDQVSVS
jgi:hypothetical protein